ncbi:hypothetical protein [Roseibium algae]|uniref:Uncharacterized protein n=1 Tax=Roseibium algae TaxID=3123038 RepID=A0ABU8TMU4_9HYPH
MKKTAKYALFGFAAACLSSAAQAESVDFERFLSSPAGAAGIAAAVAGLGECDTPLNWAPGFDPMNGTLDPNAVSVSCQYKDIDDEEFYDKSVTAKFHFWDETPTLDSLVYLP